MSRLAGLLVLVLGGLAFAEPSEPPATPPKAEQASPVAKSTKIPLRVVKILSDSEQALLFDKNRGRHVLVEVGDAVGDYTIGAIDEDGVTLAGKELPVEIILAAPEEPAPAKKPAKPAVAKTATAAAAPEDPYGDATASSGKPTAPADPYTEEPAETDEPVREVSAKDGAPAGEEAVTATHWDARTDAKPDAPADDAKPAADAPTRLSKREVNAALKDFAALSTSIDGSFTHAGLAVEKVKPGSVFAKAGLLAGDVVTAVDGKPLRTIDDAADLYARAGAMKTATVQLVRAGKPHTLRVTIQ